MTTLSREFRDLGFKHRTDAYKERAEAAKLGIDLYEFSRKFPGNYGQETRDILSHLDDAAMATKARTLYDNMREAFAQMAEDRWLSLSGNASPEEEEDLRQELLEFEDHVGMLGELAKHLEAAAELDKNSDALMEMADRFLELGE